MDFLQAQFGEDPGEPAIYGSRGEVSRFAFGLTPTFR
jgi:hypothetical protein